MRVQMPLKMLSLISGRLMKPHRVGKRSFKYFVESAGNLLQHFRESIALRSLKLWQVCKMRAADQHDFEGPDGPVRNESDESVILSYDAFVTFQFQFEVIT